MIFTIRNDALTVDIDSMGAQLASVRTPDGTEYLWQGDPDIWARRAPILFSLPLYWASEGQHLFAGRYSLHHFHPWFCP